MARSVGRPTPLTVRQLMVGGVGRVGGTFSDSPKMTANQSSIVS